MAAKKKKAKPAALLAPRFRGDKFTPAKAGARKRGGQQTDQIHAAIDYGIDISMLIQNIGRSYTERIIRHQIALNTVEKLRKVRHL